MYCLATFGPSPERADGDHFGGFVFVRCPRDADFEDVVDRQAAGIVENGDEYMVYYFTAVEFPILVNRVRRDAHPCLSFVELCLN